MGQYWCTNATICFKNVEITYKTVKNNKNKCCVFASGHYFG